jgi:ribosomal protein S27AE
MAAKNHFTWYSKDSVDMTEPKQACPRCGAELGRQLYCTPLKNIQLFCPNCGLQIQTKCPNCEAWLVMIEKHCGKCGAKNPCYYKPTR